MPAVADITRSRRQRAGSRRNKRLRNVGSFESDYRSGGIDLQATYYRISLTTPPPLPPAIDPLHKDHLHMRFLEGLTGIRVKRTRAQQGRTIKTKVSSGDEA